jgi:NTE family protein
MSKPNGDDRHRHDLLQTILKGHFASDDAELIASIKAAAEFIDLPSGGVLFHQGEHSDDVYFVLSGRLRALAEANGESKILGEIGRGETVGELALFTGEPRSASIVALRDSSGRQSDAADRRTGARQIPAGRAADDENRH